jgi:hypothetical protein
LKAQADFPEDLGHVIERRAKSILELIKLNLEKHGARVKSQIVSGVAPHTIETVARDEGADLVILSQKETQRAIFLEPGQPSCGTARSCFHLDPAWPRSQKP